MQLLGLSCTLWQQLNSRLKELVSMVEDAELELVKVRASQSDGALRTEADIERLDNECAHAASACQLAQLDAVVATG